jgi:hypothetical protein
LFPASPGCLAYPVRDNARRLDVVAVARRTALGKVRMAIWRLGAILFREQHLHPK